MHPVGADIIRPKDAYPDAQENERFSGRIISAPTFF